MEDVIKVKVIYNLETGIAEGNFPNSLNYPNNIFDKKKKTIDDKPYIEISEKEWLDNLSEIMIVKNGKYQKYQKSSDELLEEVRNEAIRNREKFLKNNSWYYEPDSMPKEIKDRRVLARQEIEQIKQISNIKNITDIEFN